MLFRSASHLHFIYPRVVERLCKRLVDRREALGTDTPDMLSLDQYHMGRHIIDGTACKLRLGRHIQTNARVCMKIMPKDANSRRFVTTEAAIMRQVERSGCVPRLYSVCEDKENYIIVMEYVDGGDLFQYLADTRRCFEYDPMALFRPIAKALMACHDAGIAHCDIKPENVLLDSKGNAKLADFGLAQRMARGCKSMKYRGSMEYLAPEVCVMKPYDPFQADVYSLGLLLYCIVAGYLPETDHCDMYRVVQDGIGAVADPRIRELLQRMVCANPGDRMRMTEVIAHPALDVHHGRE